MDGCVLLCVVVYDVCGCVWVCVGLCGCVWVCVVVCGCVWMFVVVCGYVWVCVVVCSCVGVYGLWGVQLYVVFPVWWVCGVYNISV